jgi:hypothetical protein
LPVGLAEGSGRVLFVVWVSTGSDEPYAVVVDVGVGNGGVSTTGQTVVETAMVSVTRITGGAALPLWQGWVAGQDVIVLVVVV